MVRGSVVSFVVAAVALVGVVYAFSNGSSQYVTMAQAKAKKGDDHLHLAGDIIKSSVSQDFKRHELTFQLRDQDGTLVSVIHKGEIPANMSEATKVVAIGHADGDKFDSEKLLVKCPSKYEEEPKGDTAAYKAS